MTEAEWLACEDPLAMHVAVPGALGYGKDRNQRLWRKRAFFGAACCRLLWSLLADERSQRCVEYMERQFDEEAAIPPGEASAILRAANLAWNVHLPDGDPHNEAAFAVHVALEPAYLLDSLSKFPGTWGDTRSRSCEVADLMRDVVGNPFRSVAFTPAWRTDTALALARTMYYSRQFSAMPILADALQDAGCDDEVILTHCRGDGPHVRGCWVVDLVLGKE